MRLASYVKSLALNNQIEDLGGYRTWQLTSHRHYAAKYTEGVAYTAFTPVQQHKS